MEKPFVKMPLLLSLFLFLSIISYGSAAETKSFVNITAKKHLKIGIPANSFSDKFVNVNTNTGFCISVFKEVIKNLTHEIDYDFMPFHGTYDDLVKSVANKTYDAAVGDITIMAERWTQVEFSEPFTESGLAMVVPVKPAEGWMFLKPFTTSLWIATGGILVYTMFVVWFIEHRSNSDFSGSWKDQLGNALWFTFSSLFFAHKERINRIHTRVVVIVWLFVVLILTQSYTASLTSMLTVKRLNPNIDSIIRTENTKVGCDRNDLMKTYVMEKLHYKQENVKLMNNDMDYFNSFKNGSISVAFLEIPYAKLFVNTYCKEFTVTGSSYRFGGLSFAFQKGSGIAHNVSTAILTLSENGKMKQLEELWLTSECTESNIIDDPDSLSFQSFWGLYLFSAAISTLCLLLFIVRLLNDYRHFRQTQTNESNESVWNKIVGVVKYLKNAENGDRIRYPTSSSNKVVPEYLSTSFEEFGLWLGMNALAFGETIEHIPPCSQ